MTELIKMFVNSINPVAFSIGNLKIYYYGIIFALGFLMAYFMIPWIARRKGIDLDRDKSSELITYAAIGCLIGARLFHILFYNLYYFVQNPLEIVQVWKGGLSFHGGILGIIVSTFLFCRKNKFKFYDVADIAVMPAALALFFGRIANFINGELVGKVTGVSWCVVFPNYEGCRHPTQLYEALKNLAIFGTLLFISGKKTKRGTNFWTFVLMYGFIRFFIEFYKDFPSVFFGLDMGQLLCIPMIVISGAFLLRMQFSE